MYTENEKNKSREISLSEAISILTKDRDKSTISNPEYFDKVYNFMANESWHPSDAKLVSQLTEETKLSWKRHFNSLLLSKKPESLKVAYLSGPNPENDLTELLKLGILPENVWAFESDKEIYDEATSNLLRTFPKVKIHKGKIGNFFKNTAIKFDIVYLDFCGALISANKENKNIETLISLFDNHVLNSPGCVITNFSYITRENNPKHFELIAKVVALYLYPKTHTDYGSCAIEYGYDFSEWFEKVESNLEYYYGEFISRFIMDLTLIIVPFSRIIKNNDYMKKFFNLTEDKIKICKENMYEYRGMGDDDDREEDTGTTETSFEKDINDLLSSFLDEDIENNETQSSESKLQFEGHNYNRSINEDLGGHLSESMDFFSLPWFFRMLQGGLENHLDYDNEKFIKDFYDETFKKTSKQILNQLSGNNQEIIEKICVIIYLIFAMPYTLEYYSEKFKNLLLMDWRKIAPQACDVFTIHSFIGLLLGQLSVPYHVNVKRTRRWTYKAKETQMYTDMFVLDECRYIYDMMPTLSMIDNSLKDIDAQVCYRIVLDALNKNHYHYNLELFYGNALVGINHSGFEESELIDRELID